MRTKARVLLDNADLGRTASSMCLRVSVHRAEEEAADEEARCQVSQRQAVMRQLGLTADHYLRRSQPLPASLLAAASLCAMPDASIYELLRDQQLTYPPLLGAIPIPGSFLDQRRICGLLNLDARSTILLACISCS